IVQGRKGNEVLDLVEHIVIDDGRVREVRPTMNDPMADGSQPNRVKINAGSCKLLRHCPHRPVMISNSTTRLADPLDDALGLHLGGLGHYQLILQRRGAGVRDQDRCLSHPRPSAAVDWKSSACLMAWGWIAVIAPVFTMSDISAPRDKSLTGLRSPCSTGPIATALALRCTAL